MMGHMNSFLASGGGQFGQKFPKNSNAQGVAQGECLSFDLTGTLYYNIIFTNQMYPTWWVKILIKYEYLSEASK